MITTKVFFILFALLGNGQTLSLVKEVPSCPSMSQAMDIIRQAEARLAETNKTTANVVAKCGPVEFPAEV